MPHVYSTFKAERRRVAHRRMNEENEWRFQGLFHWR